MDMIVATYQPQGYSSYSVAIADNPVRVYCSNKGNPMVEEMQENGDLFGNVDDLLDFSNDDAVGGSSETFHDNASHSTLTNMTFFCNSSSSSYSTASNNSKLQAGSSAQLPNVFDSDELCIPCEEMAELEWLSNFVEESFSSIHEYEGSPLPCNGNSTKADGDQHQQSSEVKRKLDNIGVERREEALQSSDPSTVAPLEAVNKAVVESSFSESEHQLRLMGCGITNPQLIVGQFYSGGAANTIRSKRCVRTGGAFSHAAVCFWNTKILSTEASESILETSNVSSTTSTSTNIPFPDNTETYNYHHYDILEKIQQSAKKKKRKQPTSTSKLSINYGKGMGLGSQYGSSSSCYGGLSNSKSKMIKKKVQVVKHVSIKEEKSMEEGWMSTDDDQAGGMNESSNGGRRCLHCGSQKTPQWRAGPKGPKTLCNACGVRYKSGRLFPEYRPAASPTFVESLHSNSHRRVLEMRKLRAAAGDLSSSTSTRNDDSNNHHHSNYSNNININIHNNGNAIDHDDDDDDDDDHLHHHPPLPSKPPPTPTPNPNTISITISPHNIIRHGRHSFFAQSD